MSPISTSSICSLIGISPLIVGCSVAAPTPPRKPQTALFSPFILRSLRVSHCKNPKLSEVRSLRFNVFTISEQICVSGVSSNCVSTCTDNAAVRFSLQRYRGFGKRQTRTENAFFRLRRNYE
jgi:hypothetical protein